jgi:hypothetical protein
MKPEPCMFCFRMMDLHELNTVLMLLLSVAHVTFTYTSRRSGIALRALNFSVMYAIAASKFAPPATPQQTSARESLDQHSYNATPY